MASACAAASELAAYQAPRSELLKRPPVGRGWQNAAIITLAMGRPATHSSIGMRWRAPSSEEMRSLLQVSNSRIRGRSAGLEIASRMPREGYRQGTRRQAPVRRSLRLGGVSSTRRAFRRVAAGRGRDRRSPFDHEGQGGLAAEQRIAIGQPDPFVGQILFRVKDVEILVNAQDEGDTHQHIVRKYRDAAGFIFEEGGCGRPSGQSALFLGVQLPGGAHTKEGAHGWAGHAAPDLGIATVAGGNRSEIGFLMASRA